MVALRNVHLTLCYDGAPFVGFQRQANGLAVQEVIEQALERILGVPTTLYFVARTDSGVHAWAQECTFYTTGRIPAERFVQALNALLPPAIRIRRAREVAEDFSVRRTNTGKTYVYQVLRGHEDNPFLRRYVWRPGYTLDLAAMREAAQVFIGTHDFTSLRGNNSVPADPVRTVYDVRLVECAELLRIYVTGDGFLYKMVRNIAGALVDAGRGHTTAAALRQVLAAKDRRQLGRTAPGSGLCLLHVYFSPLSEAVQREALAENVPCWHDAAAYLRTYGAE